MDSLRESLTGHGGVIRAGKKGGKWTFYLQGEYRSPGLNLNDMGFIRKSDFVGQRNEVAYERKEPKKRIRSYTLELYQEAQWSFGGESTGNRTGTEFQGTSNSLWRGGLAAVVDFSRLDTRELRGGPALRNDAMFMGELTITSNTARDLFAGAGYGYTWFGEEGSRMNSLDASVTWLPPKRLSLNLRADVRRRNYHQQYVATLAGSSTREYIVAGIDQQTVALTFRGEFFLTPELSIQYYASPFYSVGKYDRFRRVNESTAREPERRLEELNPVFEPESNAYSFSLGSESFRFSNPDFSFMQFRSNLVFRWEYKLGSTLYLVWAHDRSDWTPEYHPVGDITADLFGIPGNNVWMVKFNYWFSL